jgi:pimeloyl-ACP methyl ester carboxylesterase
VDKDVVGSQVRVIDLTAGPIDYLDTGGDGPTVVLLHGVLMNHRVWDHVLTELTPTFRCTAPALPLGAHRQPMRCYFISWPAAAGSGSMWRWQLWSSPR